MDEPTFISQFSPQRTNPEVLENILVQREDLIADSVEKIRDSILTSNKHHLLFVGPRGSGKTHLVTLIHHRLQDPKLEKKVRFAWLNEDESATSFLKLLIQIYRSLSERYPDTFSFSTISELTGLDAVTAEVKLGQSLLRELEKRTLVVLIENLDALFRDMPEVELLRWRAFVQNHPVFATIGTAQALFSGVSERTEPFFGFFDPQHLKPLDVEDARLLLEKIATIQKKTDLLDFLETPAGKARVSAIHDLAGGNPRLYLIFSEFLSREALDDLVRPFEDMVDRQLTSYYQERLRWLSPQQREIVQLLCRYRHPIPVKQIAEGLFTTHNSITGQLKPLRDMRYVNDRKIGREVLYELTEPLMRLAIQVKETHNRKPLALIVDFLRVWHDRQEIEQRLTELAPTSMGRSYYTKTLAMMDSDEPNLRHEILRRGIDNLSPEKCDDETISTARILAEESNEACDWINVGKILIVRKEWDEAINTFNHVIDLPNAIPDQIARALIGRGVTHGKAGRMEEEISDYTRAIGLPGIPTDQLAKVLVNRGITYALTDQIKEALKDLTQAIELPNAPTDQVAKALINRGVAYDKCGQTEKAITDFTDVIELLNAPSDRVVKALVSRGISLSKSGQLERAIIDFTDAIKLADAPLDQIIRAFIGRGTTYGNAGKTKEAISDFTRAIELPDAPNELVVSALNNRAITHYMTGQSEGILDDFQQLISISDQASISEILVPRMHFYANAVVQAIFAHSSFPDRWSVRITEFLNCFSRYNGLSKLGDALVQHLPELAKSPLNHAAYDAWAEAWITACSALNEDEQEHFDIPLRLLRAGIEYLKAENEKHLLVLPSEERKILRKTLGLPDEKSG